MLKFLKKNGVAWILVVLLACFLQMRGVRAEEDAKNDDENVPSSASDKSTSAIEDSQKVMVEEGQLRKALESMKLCGKETAPKDLNSLNMSEVIMSAGNQTVDKESPGVLQMIDSVCTEDKSAGRVLKINFIINQLSDASSPMCEAILKSGPESPLSALLKTPVEKAAESAPTDEPVFTDSAAEELALNPRYFSHMFGDLAALRSFGWVRAMGDVKIAELRSLDFLGLRNLLPVDGSGTDALESEVIVAMLPRLYSAVVEIADAVEKRLGSAAAAARLSPADVHHLLLLFFRICSVRHPVGAQFLLRDVVKEDWTARLKAMLSAVLQEQSQESIFKAFYEFVFDKANLAPLFDAMLPHLFVKDSVTGKYAVASFSPGSPSAPDSDFEDSSKEMKEITFPNMFRLLLLHEPFQVLFINRKMKIAQKKSTYLHLIQSMDDYKMDDFASCLPNFTMEQMTKIVRKLESATGADTVKVKTDVYSMRGIVDDAQKISDPAQFSKRIWGGFLSASNWKQVFELLEKNKKTE